MPDKHIGRVVFDDEAFRAIAGCERVQDRASALGVSPRTYRRLVRGEIEPGEHVLRAFLARFPTIDPRQVLRYAPDARRPTRVGRAA